MALAKHTTDNKALSEARFADKGQCSEARGNNTIF